MTATIPNDNLPQTFLERAGLLTARGIPVAPVNAGEKRCQLPSWPQLATTSPEVIEQWSAQNPNFNTAAVTRKGEFIVLDCDAAEL
ncbi:MAG TPA: bifunctional DNA primase/polymerase, partial [Terriglobales bacterium]|nr:bifunctional DNA primase/polymerase [Terriglobales bacterium]